MSEQLTVDLLKLLGALLFVLSLMGGLSFLLKKLGLAQGRISTGKKRLTILESMPIGSRHRAVLLQRDDVAHLVILGANGDTVVERNIPANVFHAENTAGSEKSEDDDTLEPF